jgi:phage replication O-like protein O
MSGISFRKINTQLYVALIGTDLTRACYKVLLVIIHFTLGYNQRTEAGISLKTFSDYTGLSKPAIKHALKLLQVRNIITLVSKADNRNGAVYSLNINFSEWTTGKVCLPSRVKAGLSPKDVKTYPPDVQNLPSRGKVPTLATTHIKKERKLLNKTTPPPEISSIERDISTTPPMSLSLYAPKGKAEANSLTNGYTVLPGEDRATLESDPSALGSPSRGAHLRLGASV